MSRTEGSADRVLLFTIDGEGSLPSIQVHNDCLQGTCSCTHYIGTDLAQLKPCRFAPYISGEGNVFPGMHEQAKFIWEGVLQGFSIVDEGCDTSYSCKNYKTILEDGFYSEMCDIITQELADGYITKVISPPPRCVHAMGGVEKSNGKLRPIMDCSMPEGGAINNFMLDTYEPFSYNSVYTVADQLTPNMYMAVVDLKSAYRSVNVLASHAEFQGFAWDMGDGLEYYNNNRLSFGLRCAPNIFNSLSNFLVKIAKS